jgi:hypothetical protein
VKSNAQNLGRDYCFSPSKEMSIFTFSPAILNVLSPVLVKVLLLLWEKPREFGTFVA